MSYNFTFKKFSYTFMKAILNSIKYYVGRFFNKSLQIMKDIIHVQESIDRFFKRIFFQSFFLLILEF